MNNSDYIYRKAMDTMQKHGDFDPAKVARSMGIQFVHIDLEETLGMYTIIVRKKWIFVNSNLNEELYRMTGFHEIGHAALHNDIAKKVNRFQEFQLFDMTNETEYEANAFASHILVPTDDLLENIRNGYTISQLAAMYNVNINLLLIKFQELRQMGHDFKLPDTPDVKFLGKVSI